MSNKTNEQDEKLVKRFNKGFIVSHWVQAGSFLLLLLTGLPLWTDTFSFIAVLFGGSDMAQILHRVFGVVFVLPFFILLFFDREGLRVWAKEIFTWKKHDIVFFLHFPKEFFVGNDKVPKQGFLNGGEKLNSWLSISTSIVLIVSGFILWFSNYFDFGTIQWAQLAHVLGFTLGTIGATGHIFLSAFHPNSKPSMRGITTGEITEEYAKAHHGLWYDELVEKGIVQEDKEEETKRFVDS